ncbi:MAG TPA: phosphatidylglycerophosphatase A, partial [Candidatus Glassbacteria bacterium]|nr:phosphatidylglycerophosphatase A [Candidatus Glassbacteria bacterium]
MNLIIKLIASGLGTGYAPVAPGTAGSALAAAAVYFMAPRWNPVTASAATAITFAVGVYCTSRAERFWCRDSGRMVIDEVAGMFLSLALVPAGLLNVALAFV